MEDQAQPQSQVQATGSTLGKRAEPVRSRWSPKPEQILILESIFNSGMVNPPRDETARIRKVLEKFGSVADANVFYWFQNRRSRSRRRQRLIQASLDGGSGEGELQAQPRAPIGGGGNTPRYENFSAGGLGPNSMSYGMNSGPSSCLLGSSSSDRSENCNSNSDDFFSLPGHPAGLRAQEYEQNPVYGSADLNYQPDMITVFINGVPTDVGRGAVDTKAMFGGDLVMYHSTGVPVEVNEYGHMVQNLEHGQSYFLVN
ncbi:WUSCHEL-related homeobox [Orobanche hederae]